MWVLCNSDTCNFSSEKNVEIIQEFNRIYMKGVVLATQLWY